MKTILIIMIGLLCFSLNAGANELKTLNGKLDRGNKEIRTLFKDSHKHKRVNRQYTVFNFNKLKKVKEIKAVIVNKTTKSTNTVIVEPSIITLSNTETFSNSVIQKTDNPVIKEPTIKRKRGRARSVSTPVNNYGGDNV